MISRNKAHEVYWSRSTAVQQHGPHLQAKKRKGEAQDSQTLAHSAGRATDMDPREGGCPRSLVRTNENEQHAGHRRAFHHPQEQNFRLNTNETSVPPCHDNPHVQQQCSCCRLLTPTASDAIALHGVQTAMIYRWSRLTVQRHTRTTNAPRPPPSNTLTRKKNRSRDSLLSRPNLHTKTRTALDSKHICALRNRGGRSAPQKSRVQQKTRGAWGGVPRVHARGRPQDKAQRGTGSRPTRREKERGGGRNGPTTPTTQRTVRAKIKRGVCWTRWQRHPRTPPKTHAPTHRRNNQPQR